MNPKRIVKLSNMIGIVSILLLVYWVFIFVSMEVFGFRVFRENLTQTFYLSIFGIISLMAGALMISIMFNLTRIAQKHNDDSAVDEKKRGWMKPVFIVSFPVIFVLLFAGDRLTSAKKERMLVESAKSIVEGQQANLKQMADYRFTREWISQVHETLLLMSKTDSNYKTVRVIVQDNVKGTTQYLVFGAYDPVQSVIDKPLNKTDYLMDTKIEERTYLGEVFSSKKCTTRFSSSDGDYEMFYPVLVNDRIIIFYFSDSQRYGKIGS